MNIREEDLVNNPTPRISVCLCVDTSSSMQGAPIAELNEGIQMFYDAVMQDEIALYSAEISVITFGNGVECIQDFGSLERVQSVPKLVAHGYTPMGEAVNLALDLFEKRKEEYRSAGVDYYQPWLVLMTDGEPNGSEQELDRAINRTTALIDAKKLSIFPIGIGEDADMTVLKRFSPTRDPLKLQGLKFREFFAWLSQSVSRTSQSTPGEKVPLDVEGIKGWGQL